MTCTEAPPRVGRMALVGSWTVRSVHELSGVRHALADRLPCDCAAATADPVEDTALSGVERIVLVASELVSNALQHADGPATVRLLCDGRSVLLEVVDRSPDVPPVVASRRPPGEGGFGLHLARRAAHTVGWYRTARDEKRVWARFTDPSPLAPR
ncbi:ATP-binding protein [Isoptericola variabilis]|uniref:ATP-binding region ATPase domain protein n=1 Tax=Isoptericola variabilis (strain 225) TaxID=743718 RepID=F6FU85_ISOV2|nr:ATP-binding protein [Isoptericola variabilis]AEG43281.1 ATP-binding region ATPase domain protein [Isoptericola variabilis 225]TWH35216.1 Anti-sigma regulatory factor (Ser/Thr protein kinase) [Isoptericola variabilis J7]